MQCTPEQIENKRKIALEKLKARKLLKTDQSTTTNLNLTNFYPTNNTSNGNVPRNNTFKFNEARSPQANRFPMQNSNGSTPTKSNFNATGVKPLQFNGKIVTGTCYLISDLRFEVNLSAYHVKAIEVFKTIPSRSYDMKKKLWNFLLTDYELFLNKISALNPEVVVGRIPPYAINICRKKKVDYNTIDLSQIDPELLNTLMPFQEEGVCFGIANNGRCLIADDMGLGKTFQALGIAHYYKENWPLLIATTSSMRNTWEESIHRYLPSVPVMCTQYMVTGKDYINECKILITSHDMMARCVDKLLEKQFGVIIIDESHVIKNFKSKCTKSAIALAKKAKRIILLSGTPALSRPSELYSQLTLIDEKFFGDFFEYSKRYCDGKSSNFGWDASGKSNLGELEVVLMKKFMIRRTKNEVLRMLPNKTREIVHLDVDLEQLSDQERLCLNTLTESYMSKKSYDKHSALLALFSESAKIKIPSVCTYVLQLLEQNKKFLLFAHHQKMLDAVETVLRKSKRKYIRIDGNTSSDQRKYFIDKFQSDENYICAILSITAANAGITLTAAELVIFAELHWNPSILNQAESRAHRIGQENVVAVRYLLAKGTVDCHIWALLLSKQDVLNEVGLSKDTFKDTMETEQVVTIKNDFSDKFQTNVTNANTRDIAEFFVKEPEKPDTVLKEFLEEDDDFLLNAVLDF